jgi:hypothetical protein
VVHSDQPSGWLFGEKPLKPGQKRVREDWELIWYIGFWGTTVVGIIMQVYKPDRSLSPFFFTLCPLLSADIFFSSVLITTGPVCLRFRTHTSPPSMQYSNVG